MTNRCWIIWKPNFFWLWKTINSRLMQCRSRVVSFTSPKDIKRHDGSAIKSKKIVFKSSRVAKFGPCYIVENRWIARKRGGVLWSNIGVTSCLRCPKAMSVWGVLESSLPEKQVTPQALSQVPASSTLPLGRISRRFDLIWKKYVGACGFCCVCCTRVYHQ